MSDRRTYIAAVAAMLAGGLSVAPATAEPDGRRHAMGSLFDSVRVLLIASASEHRFTDPAAQAAIAGALDELVDQAAMLAEHAGAVSDEEEFLASALERYASWTRSAMERGEIDHARRMIGQATELCVACHIRMPGARDSFRAGGFADSDDVARFSALERARLLVATRRFGPALERFEAALPALGAADPDLADDLTTYIIVSVRVRGEYRRPLPLLDRLAARDDLPPALRDALARWSDDLRQLAHVTPRGIDLAALAGLVARAEAAREATPLGGAVLYAAASGEAMRLLESKPMTPAEFAEAYLLLGLCEHRLQPSGWIPLAELHLEQAVRAAPGTELASRAYSLLRERLARVYGDDPARMPLEVAEHLDRLRALATVAAPRPGGG